MGGWLDLFRLILFVFFWIFCAIFDVLKDTLNIFISFLDLLNLFLYVLISEIESFSKLVDISNVLFWEKKLCIILENALNVLIIEPENSSFCSPGKLDYPDSHSTLSVFFKSVLLTKDYLFVIQATLICFLFVFQLLLIVRDDFKLFSKSTWHWSMIENFRLFILGLSQEVNVFHLLEGLIRDQRSRVIESHTYSIWVKKVGHTKFRIFLKESDPDKRSRVIWSDYRSLFSKLGLGRKHASSSQSCCWCGSVPITRLSTKIFYAVSSNQCPHRLSLL